MCTCARIDHVSPASIDALMRLFHSEVSGPGTALMFIALCQSLSLFFHDMHMRMTCACTCTCTCDMCMLLTRLNPRPLRRT